MKPTVLRLACLVLALAASTGSLLAQANSRPPGQISYQGYLTDANGVPLAATTPKNYTVLFKIWNNSSSGSAANLLWGEQQVVTVDRGYFTVSLGAGSPISGVFNTNDLSSLFNASDASVRYLGMTVQGLSSAGGELTPRLRLTTSPYAMLAASATSLVGPSAAANGLVVQNGLVVDGANQNSGPLSTNNALMFGSGGTEGIASQRTGTPAASKDDLALFTAGQPRLTVLNNGYVGIGATNPLAPLTVGGNFAANNNIGLQVVGANGGGSMLSLLETGSWGWGVGLLPGQTRLSFFESRYPGSAGTEDFCIARGGNVGIGTSTPTYSVTLKTPSSSYGFVQTDGNIQVGTYVNGTGGWLGTLSNHPLGFFVNGGAASLTLAPSGFVGIGTTATSPQAALHVAGTIQARTGTPSFGYVSLQPGAANYAGYVEWWAPNDSRIAYMGYNGGGVKNLNLNLLAGANYSITGGNVGIGTTTPLAPLQVVGTGTSASGSYIRYSWDGNGNWLHTWPTTDNASIIASGDIMAGALILASDARIKEIAGRSDGREDLEKLMSIEVTDYTMVDKVANGDRKYKKVIAQQVEGVYPQAVSKSTGVVPDVYSKAHAENGWITLAKPPGTPLEVGAKVRIMSDKGTELYRIDEIRADGFRVKEPLDGQVFVYGREVADFRAVDYEAIAMLNVSASQELARQLAAEKSEVAKLRAENQSLAAKLGAIEARFARLEKARDGSDDDKELVSLKRK